ncbi:hypothetical protein E6P97_01365 [Patescibacteria group bacterium]|nr:MAG: hypothetical protein E6P97_01365 [Patescibacteria group bacterium]
MSGANGTEAVLGTSTTIAGVAALPNTGANPWLQVAALIMVVCGGLVATSFIVTRAFRFAHDDK